MTFAANKKPALSGAAVLTAGVFAACYADAPLLFLAPLAVVAGLVFWQFPQLLFFTLLASIPWSFEHNFSSGLGTDLPDEPLMLLAAVAALALGLWQKRGPFHSLSGLLLLSFAWTLVCATASTEPLYSVKYAAAKGWYLLAFAALPLLLNGGKALLKRAALVLFVSMFAVTLLVLYRHAALGFTFANVNEALRPFFRNHVNYSALLVMTVPLQLAFLQHTKNKTIRLALWASLPVVTAALYLSYSRGAWLAFLVGLAGFGLIKKRWLFRSFLALVLSSLLVFGWLWRQDNFLRFAPKHDVTIFHENFSEHLAATYKGRDVSTAERFYRWTAVPKMIAEKPLTGFGPTTFYHSYRPYTTPLFRTWVSDNKEHSTVHNYFLLLAVEQGLPGLFLFLLLLGAMFWTAQKIHNQTTDPFWRTAAAIVAAILLMQCTVNFLSDLIETDKVGSVFYLCVAVLVIGDRMTRIQDTNYTN